MKIISLKERVTSEENIFNAIHALPSYIFEEPLLNTKDLHLYHQLLDEFNEELVKNTIITCRSRIKNIIENSDKFFEVSIYFRIKKYNTKTKNVEFRPMHTARLIDLICMASMLQCLMFEDDEKRKPSDLSKKIPHNFYGNRPSTSVDRIFEVWQEKYTAYNQEIVDASKEFRQSHEYKTEVTLDIKNFFPSISPMFIVDYCYETLSGRYGENQENLNTLKIILEKLIYLKVDEANILAWKANYYGEKIPSSSLYLTRGVPQGLPQSYFFGNLCMVEIRNVLKRPDMFDGVAIFYVDDSVIYIKDTYTNNNVFYKKIKILNEAVNAHINGFIKNLASASTVQHFHNQIEYTIIFHDNDKSHCCHIDDTEWNLHGLPRIVSGLDFSMLLDEIDQNIQIDKLNALNKFVENYLTIIKISKLYESKPLNASRLEELNVLIEKIKADNDFDPEIFKQPNNDVLADDLEADEKLLKRYKKLFLYNLKALKFKQEGSINIESFINDFSIQNPSPEEFERWTDNDDGSRFRAEGRMLIRNLPQKKAINIYTEACKWEKVVASVDSSQTEWLYYQKDFNGTLILKEIIEDNYNGLKLKMKLHYCQLRQTTLENRVDKLKELIKDLETIADRHEEKKEKDTDRPIFSIIGEYMTYSLRNSEEMKRRILNAFFSFVSEYEVSDSMMLVKVSGKPIPYSELRILSMLRNKNFLLKDFKHFISTLDIKSLENKMSIDYGLTKILSEIRRYVSNPVWIDSVIQTHRITKGLWQNGSKFLNAYTLHNEEHAITLIEKSIDIIKKINYLSLKQVDYFILFIACYLHDISMVIHPNLHDINDQSEKANQLISRWILKLQKKSKEFQKKKGQENRHNHTNMYKETGILLKDIFEDFYRHFEDTIRDSHAKESARFVIEKHKDLFAYLDPAMISTIAHVGESHGYDISDVYGLTSRAQHDTISEKYIMMVIRLADLHDVANDRINYHLLQQNVWHMNEYSRFHWISHLVTDSIRLIPEYSIYFQPIEHNNKIDIQQHLIETLKFELYLNVKCLSPIPQSDNFIKCSGITDIEMLNSSETTTGCFTFRIGSGVCKNNSCPTICRWTMKKHAWLVKELEALNYYLNSINQGMIRTRIELNIKFKDEFNLEQDLYDDVINFLETH